MYNAVTLMIESAARKPARSAPGRLERLVQHSDQRSMATRFPLGEETAIGVYLADYH